MGSFYCPKCGHPAEADDVFCGNCGTQLGRTSAGKSTTEKSDLNPRKNTANNILIPGIVALVLLVAVASWYLSARNSIVGRWSITEGGESGVITFEKNGYGSLSATEAGETLEFGFLYEAEDKMLTLSISANGMTESQTFPYRIDGKKMFWTDPQTGEEIVLLKIS